MAHSEKRRSCIEARSNWTPDNLHARNSVLRSRACSILSPDRSQWSKTQSKKDSCITDMPEKCTPWNVQAENPSSRPHTPSKVPPEKDIFSRSSSLPKQRTVSKISPGQSSPEKMGFLRMIHSSNHNPVPWASISEGRKFPDGFRPEGGRPKPRLCKHHTMSRSGRKAHTR